MKLTMTRDALADAVTWAARSLPAKAPIPVLSGLLLTADNDGVLAGGTLHVGAFDFETSARVEASADVHAPGKVLVSGRLLADIVKSLPAKPVDLVLNGSKLTLTCGSFKSNLLTMPLDDYPTLPDMPASAGTVDAGVFAAAVAQVAVASSVDTAVPMLTCVRVEISGDTLTLLATDRYRLAARTFPWAPVAGAQDVGVLVRAWTLREVAKTLAEGDVTVALDEGMIGFEAAGRRTTSLLVDAKYPDVRRLFPAESEVSGHAVVDTQSLIDAVRRVSLVAEKNTSVRLSFEPGSVTVRAGRGEDADGVEVVEASLSGLDGIAHGYGPGFLLDGLMALGMDHARFTFTDAKKAAVLSGQHAADGDADGSYRYLIMPMRAQ